MKTRDELRSIKKGDRIVFRAWDRYGRFTQNRKVVDIIYCEKDEALPLLLGVRARGCNPFWVKCHEVKEIINTTKNK